MDCLINDPTLQTYKERKKGRRKGKVICSQHGNVKSFLLEILLNIVKA